MNKNRRNFIKILVAGGGVLILSKVFGSSILDFFYGPPTVKDFEKFRVTETREDFSISTKDGEVIFVMDNES